MKNLFKDAQKFFQKYEKIRTYSNNNPKLFSNLVREIDFDLICDAIYFDKIGWNFDIDTDNNISNYMIELSIKGTPENFITLYRISLKNRNLSNSDWEETGDDEQTILDVKFLLSILNWKPSLKNEKSMYHSWIHYPSVNDDTVDNNDNYTPLFSEYQTQLI